jgi:hypothetical protein
VADSTASTGLKWATPSGGGKVLQVVYAATDTGVITASSSLVDTGLTATITPTLATSKILVIFSQNGCGKSSANAQTRMTLGLLRGATVLEYFADLAGWTNSAAANYFNNISGTYLDAPATTSATTYKTQMLSEGALSFVAAQDTYASTYKSASSITLMEIGA